jgi:hypothetical protein
MLQEMKHHDVLDDTRNEDKLHKITKVGFEEK